jgi:putative heme-binding domain-containing protein
MGKATMSSVSRPIRTSAVCAVLLLHFPSHALAQTASLPSSLNLSDPRVISTGATLFAKNCSVGYCHGAAGRAGRGPRLRGREWDKHYLFKVTYDGIPNSSMPAWKDRLSETEIGSIVAYVLSLSKLTSDAVDPAGVPAATSSTPVAQPLAGAASSVVPPRNDRVDSLRGDPGKGRALFFDSSNDFNCGVCHKVRGAGGEVGPDLSQIQHRPAREIFKDIVLPSAALSPGRQLLTFVLKTGESIQGVKMEESPSQLKIYDMGSQPPVLRTLTKDQIQTQEAQGRSAMPEKYGEMFTVKQLLDIIAFIRQEDSSSQVRLEELF